MLMPATMRGVEEHGSGDYYDRMDSMDDGGVRCEMIFCELILPAFGSSLACFLGWRKNVGMNLSAVRNRN